MYEGRVHHALGRVPVVSPSLWLSGWGTMQECGRIMLLELVSWNETYDLSELAFEYRYFTLSFGQYRSIHVSKQNQTFEIN